MEVIPLILEHTDNSGYFNKSGDLIKWVMLAEVKGVERDSQYVTWVTDYTGGKKYLGHYFLDIEEAWDDFHKRLGRNL